MKHYEEALKAKITAGPTAPSIDTRQSRRRLRLSRAWNQYAYTPVPARNEILYTNGANFHGTRSARRQAAKKDFRAGRYAGY